MIVRYPPRIKLMAQIAVRLVVVVDLRIKLLEVKCLIEWNIVEKYWVLYGKIIASRFFTDVSLDRATSRIARPKFSTYYQNYPRKSSSLMNLCGKMRKKIWILVSRLFLH